jgi:hypothetical protein
MNTYPIQLITSLIWKSGPFSPQVMAGCLVWELGRLLCSAWNPYGKTLRMALVWYLDIFGFQSKNRRFFFNVQCSTNVNVLDNYLRFVVIWTQEWWFFFDHFGFKNHVPPHDVHETSRSRSFLGRETVLFNWGGTGVPTFSTWQWRFLRL